MATLAILKQENAKMHAFQHSKLVNTIPFVGIVLFVLLYICSSTLYPGGSQHSFDSEGFDWVHNYWCNLMNEKGMNEQVNPARPYAITAMIVLCASLASFFVQFAHTFSEKTIWKKLITYCGLLSMILAVLIFTKYHDLMTILSSIFGLIVVIGIIKEIYLSNLLFYKITGLICVALLGLNNYIYYSGNGISILPLLQKITFLIVLLWIAGLNLKIRERLLNS